MKTISKSDNWRVDFSGMEEGYAIIIERQRYTPFGGSPKWDKTVTALSPEELRDILQLATGKEWNPRDERA